MSQNPSESSSPRPSSGPRGWNWGAFLLNWVWGLGNGTKLGLLMFVPVVNLAIPFVLGAKGNRLAWENSRWQSVEHFKKTQKVWAWAGLGLWVFLAGFSGLFFVIYVGASMSLKNSEVYERAVDQLSRCPACMASLGAPLETDAPRGSYVDSANSGVASMSIEVRGPKGAGTVFLDAHKYLGRWNLDVAELEIRASGARIDLLQTDPGTKAAP